MLPARLIFSEKRKKMTVVERLKAGPSLGQFIALPKTSEEG